MCEFSRNIEVIASIKETEWAQRMFAVRGKSVFDRLMAVQHFREPFASSKKNNI